MTRSILWYLFTLFNTSQGVFIFIAFGCKRTVAKKLKLRLTKLLYLDRFNSNNSSNNTNGSTVTCRTPTNQSTITHLNSSNKILNTSNEFKEFKAKDILFNNLISDKNQSNLSLNKSITDLYAKNFYSSESINKLDQIDTYQLNNQQLNSSLNSQQLNNHHLNNSHLDNQQLKSDTSSSTNAKFINYI